MALQLALSAVRSGRGSGWGCGRGGGVFAAAAARRRFSGGAHELEAPPLDRYRGLPEEVPIGGERFRAELLTVPVFKTRCDREIAILAKERPHYFKWRKQRYMTLGDVLSWLRVLFCHVAYLPAWMLCSLEILGWWSMDMVYFNEVWFRQQYPSK